MRLYFVRHGQTNDNAGIDVADRDVRDKFLNDTGVAQANNAAETLKSIHFDAILSSPLKRTMQTAEIINKYHDLPIVAVSNLRELEADIYLDAESWNNSFDFDNAKAIDGVEPIDVFFDRVYAAFDLIKKDYVDQNVLLVSHGGVRHALTAYAGRLPLKGSMLSERMENCQVLTYEL